MSKIEVKMDIKICMGTACYVLGAGELLDLEEQLPAPWRDRVEISGCSCGKWCHQSDQKPPFVMIDGSVYGNITPQNLLEKIKERLT